MVNVLMKSVATIIKGTDRRIEKLTNDHDNHDKIFHFFRHNMGVSHICNRGFRIIIKILK